MKQNISQRYQKALVTVAMGFRTEEDIKNNGLYRFTKEEKRELIQWICSLYNNNNKSVLALKIKQTGYRSEHININSKESLNYFIKNVDNIYEEDNEIWVVLSSVIECWRCRIYLSNNRDIIEMAYSYDDHILDHIGSSLETPYIRYEKNNKSFKISKTNLEEEKQNETNLIMQDIIIKYSDKLKKVKEDLTFIGINGISLDVRVNNGYDFHDFDVEYESTEKVISYYLPQLTDTKKLYKSHI